MEARLRSFATLGALLLLLLVAAVWGWSAVTEPFPERSGPPVCVDREFARGDKVSRGDVTVSVYNAGTRVGLAGLTMNKLVDSGFGEGSEGNAPKRASVRYAEIWTEQPKSPAVRLVSAHLGKRADVVRREPAGPGVSVVVGDAFQDLVDGPRTIRAKRATTVCGPPRETTP